MMELQELRDQIDQIDNQMAALFQKRMEAAAEIADYKKENNLPVYDSARERKLLDRVSEQVDEENIAYTRVLFSTIMGLSRSYQHRKIGMQSKLAQKMMAAVESTPHIFPERAVVACQGIEGAYSQQACERIFTMPNIMYFNNFNSVFQAVEQGLCRYGILPLENSTAGSVNQIYDLMIKHNFNIVRSTRLQIVHSLLAKKGTELSGIREIISHEQALNQCSLFLQGLKDVKVTVCENTAIAAKLVAESDRRDIAAISSSACAKLYNLHSLNRSIQNNGGNQTRFICISKELEVYPGANKTSMMMIISHKPGSLYRILSRFYELGINLVKLESRPIPERDFEFMFYFDIDASIYSPALVQLICELENQADEFQYLGSYLEVM